MSALLVGAGIGLLAAVLAGLVSRLAARRGGIGMLLAGQLGALLLRLAGLGAAAVAVHRLYPEGLLFGLGGAALVVLAGLALDVRHLLRTVRTPSEDRLRA